MAENDTKTTAALMTAEMTGTTPVPEEEADREFVAATLRGRMANYQFLARMFRKEADQELIDTVSAMRFPARSGNDDIDKGNRKLVSYLSNADDNVLLDLAIDYVKAFIGSGNDGYCAAYPYESVYTSPKRLMMQDARDEVLVIYRAAGLERNATWNEGEDHISLELEYEQIMSQRALDAFLAGDDEKCLALLRRQRNFLDEHLCGWYPMMFADLLKFAKTDFYLGLAYITKGFLEDDLEFLDQLLEDNGIVEESAQDVFVADEEPVEATV